MATLLKGAPVARQIQEEINGIRGRLAAHGVAPCLAIVRVGANEGDVYYETSAMKRAASLGISTKSFALPADATQDALLAALDGINRDPAIHGCLLLRPLPKRFSDQVVRNRLCAEKDVDGITDASLSGVFTGTDTGFAPCTAEAALRVLDFYGCPVAGRRAVVIGRSLVIGKPVAMLLLNRHATVTICHSKTEDLPAICRGAELVVAAAGRRRMLGSEYLSAGQTVIDVGVHTDADGGMCGDVDASAADGIVSAYTPVPGGLGTVTTAVLLLHTVQAAARQSEQD